MVFPFRRQPKELRRADKVIKRAEKVIEESKKRRAILESKIATREAKRLVA